MSANEILERLKSIPIGSNLDVKKIRDEIVEEHARASTTQDRVGLLQIFKVVMDHAERCISAALTR